MRKEIIIGALSILVCGHGATTVMAQVAAVPDQAIWNNPFTEQDRQATTG